jgi:hypothetical protein
MSHLLQTGIRLPTYPFSVENYRRCAKRTRRLELAKQKETVTPEMHAAYDREIAHLKRMLDAWKDKYAEVTHG